MLLAPYICKPKPWFGSCPASCIEDIGTPFIPDQSQNRNTDFKDWCLVCINEAQWFSGVSCPKSEIQVLKQEISTEPYVRVIRLVDCCWKDHWKSTWRQTSATFLNAKANKSLAVPLKKPSLIDCLNSKLLFIMIYFFALSVFEMHFSISFWIHCPAALICVRSPVRPALPASCFPCKHSRLIEMYSMQLPLPDSGWNRMCKFSLLWQNGRVYIQSQWWKIDL